MKATTSAFLALWRLFLRWAVRRRWPEAFSTPMSQRLPVSGQTLAASETQTSFVGELDILAVSRVSRHVSLRAGYEALWLASVALAPEQIDVTDFGRGVAAVNTGGDAHCHGFLGGAEITW